MYLFLEEVSEVNEDTEYNPSKEYLVKAIQQLVREKGLTSIDEDFETPFVHPMITIQKWVEELKTAVKETLLKNPH
ncbi:hypothetical protein FEM55_06350 [Dyadobacter sediminis]|uniref:Uncharacterized protein n=2 Tax=Dyadobacter sediminis TaxID=1493691 RepID=A0A5R9KL81_9BACT|nr:hypothetical protein FEM55_06350 [Dyadobacter sediminis]